jgi:hypothetical protein
MAKSSVAVVETNNTALATTDLSGFEEFAGLGTQEITAEDMAVPFLRVLAQLSPQVNKRDGAYVKDAEPGMIFNTVANEAYSGDDGVLVIPCYTNTRYVEWKPREKGGGYVGSYLGTDPIVDTTRKDDRGQDILPNGNLLSKTAQWFVLMLHPENGPQRCLITMSSTQLKKSRSWLTTTQNIMGKGANGRTFVMPIMSQIYRVKTTEERNDKGSWFGWDIVRERQLDIKAEEDAELYQMAVAFSKSITAGEVKVKDEHPDTSSDDHGNSPF